MKTAVNILSVPWKRTKCLAYGARIFASTSGAEKLSYNPM